MNKTTRRHIFEVLSRDAAILSQLSTAVTHEEQLSFTDKLAYNALVTFHSPEERESFFGSFCSWGGFGEEPRAPDEVVKALYSRTKLVASLRKQKRDYTIDVGLHPTKSANVPLPDAIHLQRLDPPYPPLGSYIAENQHLYELWADHFAYGRQPDSRLPRRPVDQLDFNKLQHTVTADESCLIKDKANGKLVGIVIRDFCKSQEIVEWIKRVVEQGVSVKKSVRLEDPGSLVLMGYTAGARNRPCFDLARNVRLKQDSTVMDRFNYESSSVFALFWNLCRIRLPQEVTTGIEDFLASGIPRMDAGCIMNTGSSTGTGHYTLNPTPEISFKLHEVPLAPPAGVFACNYSRATHYEHQPHEYSISWTLGRSQLPSSGGNFFISRYGVRVEQAENTVVVWMPKDAHGTSLQDLDPRQSEPQFIQTGMAFVTSPRILSVWEKFMKTEITKEMALKELEEDEDVRYE